MRKILLGLLLTTLTPFTIIFGYYVLSIFNIPEGVLRFAYFLSGVTIVVNWFIGILLIVKGYQDTKVFKGWE